MPYSNLMLTYVRSKKGSHNFLLKNAPRSRKLNMLDRRRRDVTLFEMIDKSTYLAQIKFDELGEDHYWTMLDREG